MKIKPSHQRDFSAYLYWYKITRQNKFCPFVLPPLKKGKNSALKCWLIYESQGKILTCTHMRLFKAVLIGKQLLNFQIKEWSQGLGEVPLFVLQICYPLLPSWVWEAVKKQFHRRTEKAHLS